MLVYFISAAVGAALAAPSAWAGSGGSVCASPSAPASPWTPRPYLGLLVRHPCKACLAAPSVHHPSLHSSRHPAWHPSLHPLLQPYCTPRRIRHSTSHYTRFAAPLTAPLTAPRTAHCALDTASLPQVRGLPELCPQQPKPVSDAAPPRCLLNPTLTLILTRYLPHRAHFPHGAHHHRQWSFPWLPAYRPH